MKILISFILYLVFFSSAWATEEFTPKEPEDASLKLFPKFKIGVELQESSHLCPWHGERSEFQNKEIFSVSVKGEKGRKLWSLVIDTDDIEFVTSPFPSDKEDMSREECMNSINNSILILQKVLEEKNTNIIKKITELKTKKENTSTQIKEIQNEIITLEKEAKVFKEAKSQNELKNSIMESFEEVFNSLKKADLETAKELDNTYSIQKGLKTIKSQEREKHATAIERSRKLNSLRNHSATLHYEESKNIQECYNLSQKIEVTFQEWIEAINTSEEGVWELTLAAPIFDLVKYKPLVFSRVLYEEKGELWMPRFSSQVTLQHPLSVTIPLYFYIFGENVMTSSMHKAIPCYKKYREFLSQKKISTELCTPLNGLIFIHALTLFQISNTARKSDSEGLNLTLGDYEKSKQIDVKMHLQVMSRRAFSDMFEDIKSNQDFSYIEQFKERIFPAEQIFFNSYKKIEKKFKAINYGQQFFDESGEIKDLRFLSGIIEESFYKENKEKIEKLLKLGIITTTMIRNFNDKVLIEGKSLNSLFDSYFNESLESIQDTTKRIGYSIEFHHDGQFNFFDDKQIGNYGIGYKYETEVFFKKDTRFDTVSPPWFLTSDDSMGNISRKAKDNPSDNEIVDIDYGEAIIEIRNLDAISLRLLEATNLLSDPHSIKNHFNDLFSDIRKFQKFVNHQSLNAKFLDLSLCI